MIYSYRTFWGCFVLSLLTLLLVGCQSELSVDQQQTFQKAVDSFNSAQSAADFLQSAQEYQKLIDGGLVSGAVFYNQGNAYAQAGDKPRALAAYRQAFPYMPNDPYLAADVKTVGGKAHTVPLIENLFFWQNWISYPGKATLALILAGLTFVAALIPWVLPGRGWKTAALILSLTFLVSLGSFGYDYYRFNVLEQGIAIDTITARKGDSTTYAAAFTQPMAPGTEFCVLQKRGDWLLVRLDDNLEGWVEASKTIIW